jgi:hypothetical protein
MRGIFDYLGICQPLQKDSAPWGYLWKALDLMSIVSNAVYGLARLGRRAVVTETGAVAFSETVRCYIRLDCGTIESLVERCLSIAVWAHAPTLSQQ